MDALSPFQAPSPSSSSATNQGASNSTPSPSGSDIGPSNTSPPSPSPDDINILDSKVVASSPAPASSPLPPQQNDNAADDSEPAAPNPIASSPDPSIPATPPDSQDSTLTPPPSSLPVPQPDTESPANSPPQQSSHPPPPPPAPAHSPHPKTPLQPPLSHPTPPPKASDPTPPPKRSPPRPAPLPSPISHHPATPTLSPSNSSHSDPHKIAPPGASISTSTPSSTWSSSSSNNGSLIGAVAGGTVAAVIVVGIAIAFLFLRRRKTKKSGLGGKNNPNGSSLTPDMYHASKPPGVPSALGNTYPSFRGPGYRPGLPDSAGSHLWFTYEELKDITNGFSSENLLGEGGFGCVYKACISDGRTVAVKQLKVGSGQGDKEFRAEVEIISRVHHRHLVSLVGYCISDHQRLLVYDYLPNKTLEYHLHEKGLTVMDWSKRVKIAIGSARGLAYLHEDCHPRIIHRDIKSANILLDNCFEAQVADFGLAKLTNDAHSHVSTRVMGTFGYMAPEYASSGKLTDRSDVFSFGVVLLELITGRKPVDPSQPLGDESLVEWVRPLLVHALETGEFEEFVDPRLEQNYVKSEMLLMIEAAAACVRHAASKRPRMAQVVRALDSAGDDLSNGMKFGQSQVFNSAQYSAEIRMFHRGGLGSDEYSSGSYESSGEHEHMMSSAYSAESTAFNSPPHFKNNTREGDL